MIKSLLLKEILQGTVSGACRRGRPRTAWMEGQRTEQNSTNNSIFVDFVNYAVKASKLACYDHTMRKQGSYLEKEMMQGTVPGARRRGRPRTAWMDNIKTWTGLTVEDSKSEWQRTEINGESTSMVWPTLGSRTAREQNRTTTRWASLHYSMRPIVTDVPYVVCVFVCCPQPVSQFYIVSRCYKLRRQVTSTLCLSAMSRMIERLAEVK